MARTVSRRCDRDGHGTRGRPVHWILGIPDVFLNTVGDLDLLPRVLDAARRFERRPDDDAMAGMRDRRRVTSRFGLPT